jgi:hypothetical protein
MTKTAVPAIKKTREENTKEDVKEDVRSKTTRDAKRDAKEDAKILKVVNHNRLKACTT